MGAKEVFGLPSIIVSFRTRGATAIRRSARGIVVMILKQETSDKYGFYKIKDVTDIPEALTEANKDLVRKCLLGTPYRILLYTIPTDDVSEAQVKQNTILQLISSIKWNYICAPTGTQQDQEDLASYIKSQKTNYNKTFKAVVANHAADDYSVINFCTGNIKVKQGEDIKTYTATEYTARIAGILAGLPLDRSATYYQLHEVESVETYEDINEKINKGQLLLIDEFDDMGVKIARACNSLTSFTTDVGEDFRFIKIIEGVHMVKDDITETFKEFYAGKKINDYNGKMNLITAIMVYIDTLKGNVIDASPAMKSFVDIDEHAQANYAKLKMPIAEFEKLTAQEIREYNTGTEVFLAGKIYFVNAMEGLKIDFIMNS